MNLSENLRERPKFVTEPKRILIPATKKKLEVNISNRLINIFIWRIITSSAKLEKRIVAHKASIIEIVKITIEGAHEPLSSSYSSGEGV